jgi:DNA-binding transcriptional MocR family regulator
MISYYSLSKEELKEEQKILLNNYEQIKLKGLKLDMSRGKPCLEQLDLSNKMLGVLSENSDFTVDNGIDARNYGILDGISNMKKLFSQILGVSEDEVIVGGNSSLNLMFDILTCFYTHGVLGCEPWCRQGEIKFLCPVPGYDRHFSITEYYGIKMIQVPIDNNGPDMNIVEELVENDEKIKGIWCVPKYSNPTGVTYSDEVVKRFAKLRPKAKDFRVFWDNSYCVHDLSDNPDELLNLMDECKKQGNEDMPLMFCSTSKITFAGAGVSAAAASTKNLSALRKRFSYQTIGSNKLNQLRHCKFLKDMDNLKSLMELHRAILKPKFTLVNEILTKDLLHCDIAKWTKPKGGYFISVNVMDGTAKDTIRLCKEAGVILTEAGAAFPLKDDPNDRNIRLAPSYPSLGELEAAMEVLCVCTRLAAVSRLLTL